MTGYVDPPFGWADGPTNRMDALMDLGYSVDRIIEATGITEFIIRRRRTERRAMGFPVARPYRRPRPNSPRIDFHPTERQLEIAIAAITKPKDSSMQNYINHPSTKAVG